MLWRQERNVWIASVKSPSGALRTVGSVREDRETDEGATGWQAYYLGLPTVPLTHLYTPPIRLFEPVGFFRRLRDAMRHVAVLHSLEQ